GRERILMTVLDPSCRSAKPASAAMIASRSARSAGTFACGANTRVRGAAGAETETACGALADEAAEPVDGGAASARGCGIPVDRSIGRRASRTSHGTRVRVLASV